MNIPAALLDCVVQGWMTQDEVEAVCRSLKEAVIERVIGGEMAHHLGYSPGEAKPAELANHRNGTTGTTASLDGSPPVIHCPRIVALGHGASDECWRTASTRPMDTVLVEDAFGILRF